MNLVVEGIKYQLYAKKRHGIHSPFVYHLSDYGLSQKMSPSDQHIMQLFDEKQRKDKRILSIKDLGAGSKKLTNTRSVQNIYRHNSSGKKYGELLWKLVKHLKPESILELGTSIGNGTLAMHLAAPSAKIITMEGCPSIAQIAQENFSEFSEKNTNIELQAGAFHKLIPMLRWKTIDLIFIDGHHNGKALQDYIELLYARMDENTMVIIDDIRWSSDMHQAWKAICLDPRFHLSIDFFRMGMIAKRSFQAKEHFILKH